MKKISCVIFDLDGTLADTSRLIFASFNHVASRYTGRTWSEPEILATFGPTEEVAIRNIVGGENAPRAIEEFHRFYLKRHPEMAAEHRGIREILEFLRSQGVILALFTGKGKRTTLVTLSALGLSGYFDMIVTGDDVENHKPSAEGIRKVLAAYALPPAAVLMVGDSAPDVIAARTAGVPVAVVAWDPFAGGKAMLPDPDFRFGSVADFSAFLRTVFPNNDSGWK
ncbi:MAG TPA: HAD-IA family hydrolase [Bacteroidota bacterium]|nr:HAD-IA family hydrolase [Bacteroidota bacterium]